MQLVTCPKCGAGIDMTHFEAGSIVVCGGCGGKLRVPAAQPVQVAPVVIPSSGAPAQESAPTPAPRKPKGRDKGRGSKKGSQRRGSERQVPERRPARRSSNVMGPLLIVGAALILVGGAVMMLNKSKEKDADPAETADAETTSTKGDAKTSSSGKKGTELERLAASVGLSVPAYLDMIVNEAGFTADKARQSYVKLEKWGEKEHAEKALKQAKELFPSDRWVNQKLGLRDRTADLVDFGNDEMMGDRLFNFVPYMRIRELFDATQKSAGAGWVDPATSANIDRWMAECRVRDAWLKDPLNERSERVAKNLSFRPEFEKVKFQYESARPFMIFWQEPEDGDDAPLRDAVSKMARVLPGFYQRFHAFLRSELKLDAPRLEDTNDKRLLVFVFRNRRAFDQWHLDTNQSVPAKGVLAYYSPVNEMTVLYAPTEEWQKEILVETAMHEATHHLFDIYQRWFCDKAGKRLPEGDAQLSPMRVSADTLFWFQEGIADYFSATGGKTFRPEGWQFGAARVNEVRAVAAAKATKTHWKPREFLFADQSEIYERAEIKGWGGRGAGALKALMYSHGWLAVHYFLHGDNGRYRKPFQEYLRREISGAHIRKTVKDLEKVLPEVTETIKNNPEVTEALNRMGYTDIAWVGIIQQTPELGKLLRMRDFLRAFGLPDNPSDPKVKVWMDSVDAGFERHAKSLVR